MLSRCEKSQAYKAETIKAYLSLMIFLSIYFDLRIDYDVVNTNNRMKYQAIEKNKGKKTSEEFTRIMSLITYF